MKKVILLLVLAVLSSQSFGFGSTGSGTGEMPSSKAQTVLRAGYEKCKATTSTKPDFISCMKDVEELVRVENMKANR